MKYSIILQNTTTKQVTTYSVEHLGGDLFYQFEINTESLTEGEYKLYLIENNEWQDIVINQNNIPNSTLGDGTTIVIVTTDLLRVGNYKATPTTAYNSERKFRTYNGK